MLRNMTIDSEEKDNVVVLTVYFEGTAFEIDSQDLHKKALKQKQLSYSLFSNNQNDRNKQLVLGFDGCGTKNVEGFFLGGLFGVGLDGQCRTVAKKVQKLVEKGKKVIVNSYGLSRGGIAALLLAKKLGKYSVDKVETNLALIDPVPGNLPITAKIDFLNISFAARTMDLSACKNLKRVLCLYPYKSLKYLEGHAPIIPTYSQETNVEEDVVVGCHAEAQIFQSVRYRIIDFLIECGTQFNENFKKILREGWETIYQRELREIETLDTEQVRESHSHRQLEIVVSSVPNKKFLNTHHQKISGDTNFNIENCKLNLRRSTGLISYIKRNPYLYRAVKWLILGITIATILYFTGGLALIPFAGAYFAKMGGAWSILSASPLAALGWSAALHFIIRPIVNVLARLTYYIFRKDNQGHEPPLPIIETQKNILTEFKNNPPTINHNFYNNKTLDASFDSDILRSGTSPVIAHSVINTGGSTPKQPVKNSQSSSAEDQDDKMDSISSNIHP